MIVTLKEKSTINSPYYTWKLINRDSFDEYIISPDNNSITDYYDSFTISVGSTPSATGSSVMIDAEEGQYDYYVYEMSAQYDLNLSNAITMVESGILQIEGTYSSLSTITSFTESNDDTIRVFNEL